MTLFVHIASRNIFLNRILLFFLLYRTSSFNISYFNGLYSAFLVQSSSFIQSFYAPWGLGNRRLNINARFNRLLMFRASILRSLMYVRFLLYIFRYISFSYNFPYTITVDLITGFSRSM